MATNTIKENHLIQGESFDLEKTSDSPLQLLSDEDINEKYMRGEIRIVTEQARYPLDTIENMLDSNKYNLNPEYQRRKRWDSQRKSRLIESFIMNVPIPPIFLYEIDYSIYEVMDGQQRLTAIYDFYKGKYKLEELEYWRELNGKSYQELPEQVKRGIDRRYLSSIVLLQETAKSKAEADYLKQIVFERLNSGGEKLTPQETRNALQNGKFNQLCIELAKNEFFRKMWKLPLESQGEEKLLESEPYRKMEDVELVLRFFAYRHIEKFSGVTVEKFLDEYLKQANKFPDHTLKQLESLFNATISLIYKVLDESAFLLPQKQRNYKKPTKTIYDSIMQAFAQHIDNQEQLIINAKEIKENMYKNLNQKNNLNKDRFFDGRYNNRGDVKDRIKYYYEFLQEYTK